MRKLLFLLTIVVILPIFSVFSSAEDYVDKYISEFEETLPDGFEGITEDTDQMIERIGLRGLISEISEVLSEGKGEIGGFFLLLLCFFQ